MATFKVGQRVRIVGARHAYNLYRIGREGTVLSGPTPRKDSRGLEVSDYWVEIDGCDANWVLPEHMAPLTDPKADAFIERIKKLEPLKQPETA